jgi:hypothetical protein
MKVSILEGISRIDDKTNIHLDEERERREGFSFF